MLPPKISVIHFHGFVTFSKNNRAPFPSSMRIRGRIPCYFDGGSVIHLRGTVNPIICNSNNIYNCIWRYLAVFPARPSPQALISLSSAAGVMPSTWQIEAGSLA